MRPILSTVCFLADIRHCCTLPILLCGILMTVPAQAAPLSLRVGVYHNPPKILVGEQGEPSGIMGNLLIEMARRENWQLQAVPCHWNQCLEWLETGHIDLMPDVALTEARDRRFDFHQIPALLSWSQVYEAPGQRLASLLDLEGKRVAVLAGSVQQDYLQQMVDSFNLKLEWVAVNALEEGFDAVVQGRADAVATNHFLGDQMARQLDLHPSPILFQPSKLFYATGTGHHSGVLGAIDRHLQGWQADADSPYFEILRRWGVDRNKKVIPLAVWWVISALGIALLLAIGLGQLLRRQVADRTRSLRSSEARLNTILNSVDAHIYIKDRHLRYQYANRKVCELFGLPLEQIIGQTDDVFFDAATCTMLREHDLRVIEQGERVAEEEHNALSNNALRYIYLSVKLPLRDANDNIYALCGISTDITAYRQIQDQLHRLAFFDPLTDLPNRRLLLDRVRHALDAHADTAQEGALLVIDLNNFKVLNDTLGHDAGDQLLQQVSRRLEHNLRNVDTAGRLSGDEFALILTQLGTDSRAAALHALRSAQRIMAQLSDPYILGDIQHITSCSIGVGLFSDAGNSAEILLKNADLALFEAKSTGRNTLRFFNPAMQTEVNRRTRLESALRDAITTDVLELHVQPQRNQQGSVIAMEALLRWHDTEMGWIAPADFIPIAESSGLIIALGEWVLRRACRILAHWSTLPDMAELVLAVNISPRQFRHAEFVDNVEHCIRHSKINPALLELEITEGLLIDDLEQTIERMNRLRSQGIRFSLDDFGTGYASLGYLKRLPLFQLKIDQSFVRDLMTDSNDEAIVRTIIALGHSLDLQVIAEGVETEEQAARLQALGCNCFQGYFFGKPASTAEWERRISMALANHQ